MSGRDAFHALQAIFEARMHLVELSEIAHVAMARTIYTVETGRPSPGQLELRDWAVATGRHNLASLLEQSPPHITTMFTGRIES